MGIINTFPINTLKIPDDFMPIIITTTASWMGIVGSSDHLTVTMPGEKPTSSYHINFMPIQDIAPTSLCGSNTNYVFKKGTIYRVYCEASGNYKRVGVQTLNDNNVWTLIGNSSGNLAATTKAYTVYQINAS